MFEAPKIQPKVEVTTYQKAPMSKIEIAGTVLFASFIGLGALVILGGALARLHVKPFHQWTVKIAGALQIGNGAIQFGAIATGVSAFGIGTFGVFQVQHNRSIIIPQVIQGSGGEEDETELKKVEGADDHGSHEIINHSENEEIQKEKVDEIKKGKVMEQEELRPMMSLKDRVTLSKKHTAAAVVCWTIALASLATLLLALVPKTPLGNCVRKYPGAWVPLWVLSTFSSLVATTVTCHVLRPRIAPNKASEEL